MPDFNKKWRPSRSAQPSIKFAERVNELRESLRHLDPELIAVQSGVSYQTLGPGLGELRIQFFGEPYILGWPELKGSDSHTKPLTDFQLALLFYYLLTADGTPVVENWVSFADLPHGRMYNAAFQGYSGNELVKAFGCQLDAFQDACRSTGGIKAGLANASYVFQALPRVPLMVTYWLGDEDFPSTSKILFDQSVSHYLPVDACAILGSMLVRRLLHSQE